MPRKERRRIELGEEVLERLGGRVAGWKEGRQSEWSEGFEGLREAGRS